MPIFEGVVECSDLGSGVALIKMQDKENKNTFSDALMRGLVQAFESASTEATKAIVLTGYDSYFSSGGTREGLLRLHEGKGKFTDHNVYSLALECPVPVVSAMQGHGVGGGFVMGLFADVVVMSLESIYTTNFMKYGFTPGMGATLVLPKKLGISLAQEMLLTARNYYGEELQRRGAPFTILPRAQVLNHAVDIARSLAEKPRVSLITLKSRLVAELRAELDGAVQQEVAMHEQTFHRAEVKQRIETLFGN